MQILFTITMLALAYFDSSKSLIYLAALVAAWCIKIVNCIVANLHRVAFYSVKDIIMYFVLQKWKEFDLYGIDMFVAMFGKGKTLSMTHRARQIYAQYGDSVKFLSNYHLNGIPYTPLTNFNQLVDLGADQDEEEEAAAENPPDNVTPETAPTEEPDNPVESVSDPEAIQEPAEEAAEQPKKKKKIVGYVVLLDEISSVLSHRNFSSFPLEMLSMLCQQRKRRIYIMCSAQRFFMVDKIFRGITTRVIICDKVWRFVHNSYFDAWDYENATTTSILQRLGHSWWFCRDKDYAAYDTSEMITRSAAADFISNEEAIVRKGLDAGLVCNEAAIKHKKRTKKSK
ncbi:MAG: hypothetical protein IJY09_06395 [Lachnospiraceae bacterium]|nr:hypothetical protein [Lachnospiraceae bacterium]